MIKPRKFQSLATISGPIIFTYHHIWSDEIENFQNPKSQAKCKQYNPISISNSTHSNSNSPRLSLDLPDSRISIIPHHYYLTNNHHFSIHRTASPLKILTEVAASYRRPMITIVYVFSFFGLSSYHNQTRSLSMIFPFDFMEHKPPDSLLVAIGIRVYILGHNSQRSYIRLSSTKNG